MNKEPAAKKKRNLEVFATKIASKLKTEYHAGHFKHLSIIAAPKFAGLLRSALSDFHSDGEFQIISKDLINQDAALIYSTLAANRTD